jgi:hypothetical protein
MEKKWDTVIPVDLKRLYVCGTYMSRWSRKDQTEVENILKYGCDIWTVYYRLKKKLLSTEMDFYRRAARTPKILSVRNN